ncbi:recombinase RecA [Mycoplasma mycoides subsp. mycoides]|uniref:Protein RecA n=9 Tax=Mycoplasma mycoides group TaxID=656088 RepID=RECA_MYCMS|nr:MULTISPECIES: recombinase RecA [Mycoplasma mycoides group]P62218.1 RecName: Full=Protein RecA; AltName: Full=Recombinase A [Mycoplasma mycoides subsp. mycoides SC str. PG1]ADK69602.1 RecA protein [Mycoplasma mycoides subsp. mycoides SC str. Gladysdale]ADR24328.1 RecA protein [Mycoplasma leachii PG50]AIZ55283.1 recombinase A [Mycoplasma mycoides subsp. mycoides]AME10629.1 recombinase A [Mycoplasma mycoides subsp. mycoides]AME11639.1 recombinase A [Mycoplasma mycoides subsp. mycoides]
MSTEIQKIEDNNLKESQMWNSKELKEAIKEIEKMFGKGSIMVLGQSDNLNVETFSSGSLLLDNALGIGGYPKGRIIEIYGPESSGKTTLSLHAICEIQKLGGIAAFIDAEHSLDPKYCHNLGIDTNKLLVSQPDNGEQALDILEMLINSNSIDLIIVDSVAALVPKTELEGEMSDQSIGLQARMMSKALRKLNGLIAKSNTTVIFINQLREKIGVIFGNPETTTGGKALKFFSSIRLEVRKSENILSNSEIIGNKIKIKIVKNKTAIPFKTATISLLYNKGIDKIGELVDLLVSYEIVEKSGVWYSYQNEKIGQGKTSVIQWLNADEKRTNELIQQVKKIIEQKE